MQCLYLVLRFWYYKSASSSVIVFSKDVWDCWKLELWEIREFLSGGGNIWFGGGVSPWVDCGGMWEGEGLGFDIDGDMWVRE